MKQESVEGIFQYGPEDVTDEEAGHCFDNRVGCDRRQCMQGQGGLDEETRQRSRELEQGAKKEI